MSKSAPNPLANTYSPSPSSTSTPTISRRTLTIAGLLCNIYGLDELSPSISSLACLWLLHPRLQTQECMAPIAASILGDYNARRRKRGENGKGLIAVSLDQRNHGSRKVDARANESWRGGNERHAQDMFSIYNGTAHDTTHLLDHIPSYLPLHLHSTPLSQNLVLGISLGAHAAWQVLMHDPRFSAAVIIIGCPDYTALMSDRARLSKRDTYTKATTTTTTTTTKGDGFIGSKDFPPGLIDCVRRSDPVGCILDAIGQRPSPTGWPQSLDLSLSLPPAQEENALKLKLNLQQHFKDKSILNLSGGADKLVPYRCGAAFLGWLGAQGRTMARLTRLEDRVFDGVGHEVSEGMVAEAVRFVGECVAEGEGVGEGNGEGEGGGMEAEGQGEGEGGQRSRM